MWTESKLKLGFEFQLKCKIESQIQSPIRGMILMIDSIVWINVPDDSLDKKSVHRIITHSIGFSMNWLILSP